MKRTLTYKAGYDKGSNPVNIKAINNILEIPENSAYVQSESHYSDNTSEFTIVVKMIKKPQ
jgi:hypothetical protein